MEANMGSRSSNKKSSSTKSKAGRAVAGFGMSRVEKKMTSSNSYRKCVGGYALKGARVAGTRTAIAGASVGGPAGAVASGMAGAGVGGALGAAYGSRACRGKKR